MVERFSGRIADVPKTHRFVSGEDLEQTIMRYVALQHTVSSIRARQSRPCANYKELAQIKPGAVRQKNPAILRETKI